MSTTTPWQAPAPDEHRSPCPGLNSLANGGHLPRSGRVTEADLVRAMHERLGLAPSIGRTLAKAALKRLGKPGPDGEPVLDLADLSLHGFIEHDASLTRRDAHRGDATRLDSALLDQFLALSRDGQMLTLEDVVVAHQLRMAQSREGGHQVPFKAGVLGTLEAAILYVVLAKHGALAVADAREFLLNERIPEGVAPKKIGWGTVLGAAARMAVMGNVPWSRAARRARETLSR